MEDDLSSDHRRRRRKMVEQAVLQTRNAGMSKLVPKRTKQPNEYPAIIHVSRILGRGGMSLMIKLTGSDQLRNLTNFDTIAR